MILRHALMQTRRHEPLHFPSISRRPAMKTRRQLREARLYMLVSSVCLIIATAWASYILAVFPGIAHTPQGVATLVVLNMPAIILMGFSLYGTVRGVLVYRGIVKVRSNF